MAVNQLVAIDPGPTTGCVHAEWTQPGGELVWYGWAAEPIMVLAWLGMQRPEARVAVVERPPAAGHLAATHAFIVSELAIMGYHIVHIGPGEWKPWIKGNPLPTAWRKRAGSPHVRDALGMAQYYVSTRYSALRAGGHAQLALPI